MEKGCCENVFSVVKDSWKALAIAGIPKYYSYFLYTFEFSPAMFFIVL